MTLGAQVTTGLIISRETYLNNAVFLSVYATLAGFYLALLMLFPEISGVPKIALKVLPIAMLLWLSVSTPSPYRRWLCAAVLLSALGDIFLASSLPHQFIFGLASFLLTHLAYCMIFIKLAKGRQWPTIKVVFLTLYLIILLTILIPAAGALAVPVSVYALTICVMGALAIKTQHSMLGFGALTFVLSDTVIGINKFVLSIPMADIAIMSSYYLAQLILVLTLTRHASANHTS
ncbi:lysoplasmalogenase [Aestuariibacter salexigens]|uniref:lysoplasmalogenase n=1 Tax=Aestuariibacter salexigens TaxID=226010 RepID=UPI000688AA70|nr:lysoplasmalogenase [Aestuariibacter salexigens]